MSLIPNLKSKENPTPLFLSNKPKKFLVFSEHGEIASLAVYLQDVRHQEVKLFIPNTDCEKIAEGMVEHVKEWWRCVGENYIWIFDGNNYGDLQDWLRSRNELVVGGTKKADELENSRQAGQQWFKKAGFNQPMSKNFTSIDEAISFVQAHKNKEWVIKQNGDLPKSLNHVGKFKDNIDTLYHLEELKKSWNDSLGTFDVDLMEKVEGTEVAASAYFNGKTWMKNKDGKVVGWLNFEEKKSDDGGLGSTCGETGTTFIGVDETNSMFKEILLKPEIENKLREVGFKGSFDINGSWTKSGYVAFEATCRFGVPSIDYEQLTATDELENVLEAIAKGEDTPISIKMGVGMVIVVTAKPFPYSITGDDKENTSKDKKLWILDNGVPTNNFSPNQKKHIFLYNFERDENNDYKVATNEGYLLTCTASGTTIKTVRKNLLEYIKNNIYIENIKYRQDIGARVEDFTSNLFI